MRGKKTLSAKNTSSKQHFEAHGKHAYAIIENLPDGLYYLDKDFNYKYVNKKGAELAGMPQNEIIGKNVKNLFPETFNLPFGKASERVMKTKKSEIVEAYYPRFNKWYENVIYPSEDGISIFAREVSNRVVLEKNMKYLAEASKVLGSSLDYKTTLVTVAHLGVPEIADWCTVDMLNDKGEIELVAVAHVDPEKVKWAKKLRSLNPPDMKSKTGLPNVLRTGKPELYPEITDEMLVAAAKNKKELELTRSIGFTSVMIVPIFSRKKAVGAISFVTTESRKKFTPYDLDMAEELANRASLAIENALLYQEAQKEITSRTKTESKLIETQKKYDALVDSNIIGVMIADLNNGIVYEANEAFLQMMGCTKKDLKEHKIKWNTMTPETYKEADEKAVRDLLSKGMAAPYEKEYVKSDGKRVPVIVGAVLLNPETTQTIAFILDISERKALEERKDEFLSIASHELKTPLTSIKGYTQILERIINDSGTDKEKVLLKKTTTYIDRLNGLISDLLDVSRIQSGKLQYNNETFNFDEMVHEAVEEVQPTTSTHRILVNGKTGQKLKGDKNRLQQVVTNILSNAVKYSPKADKVFVRLEKKNGTVQVSVEDFGVGIPQGKANHVFERFYRVDETAKSFSGLGIGLYISSQIVKRHKGIIAVASEFGKGSTFTLELPVSS